MHKPNKLIVLMKRPKSFYKEYDETSLIVALEKSIVSKINFFSETYKPKKGVDLTKYDFSDKHTILEDAVYQVLADFVSKMEKADPGFYEKTQKAYFDITNENK